MLTSHFQGSAEEGGKGSAFGPHCSWAVWVLLTLALPGSPLWHSPGLDTSLLKDHMMLPRHFQSQFQGGNRNLAGSRQCLRAGPKHQASLSQQKSFGDY